MRPSMAVGGALKALATRRTRALAPSRRRRPASRGPETERRTASVPTGTRNGDSSQGLNQDRAHARSAVSSSATSSRRRQTNRKRASAIRSEAFFALTDSGGGTVASDRGPNHSRRSRCVPRSHHWTTIGLVRRLSSRAVVTIRSRTPSKRTGVDAGTTSQATTSCARDWA